MPRHVMMTTNKSSFLCALLLVFNNFLVMVPLAFVSLVSVEQI